mmetsp:Transcript_28962/g.52404  ORF Transcript_28962/g.52404 Transcript_28962/m.52404 type:complete len:251 (+) Transcript_28962:490-1242(+)
MNMAQWYPSVTSLGNSKIVVQGGTGTYIKSICRLWLAQVYTDDSLFFFPWVCTQHCSKERTHNARSLQSQYWKMEIVDRSKQHALLPKECVVITFPSFQNDIWRLDPRGNGSLKSVATVPGPPFKKEAPATMFDRHKILAIQGVQEAVVLDIRNPNPPTFEKTGQLREKRSWANSVFLPNGEVLVVGGSSVSQQLDTAVKYAEIWNPTTGQWRVAAEAVKARLYQPLDSYSLARCNHVGWWRWPSWSRGE